MDFKNLFIFLAIFGSCVIQISTLTPKGFFVKTVSFEGIIDYLSGDLNNVNDCYSKIRKHYEDIIKLFVCEMDATPRKINALKIEPLCKMHAKYALTTLKSIGNDVLELQKELKEVLADSDEKKIESIKKKGANQNMQAKYIAYLSSRNSLEKNCINEIRNVVKNITYSVVTKVAERFSEFTECMKEHKKL